MLGKTLALTMIAVLAPLGGSFAMADNQNGGWDNGWHGTTFTPNTPAASPSDNQAQAPIVYDIAPAMARAAYWAVQCDQAEVAVQLAITQAHKEFWFSQEYVAAEHELAAAQKTYDAACEPVIGALLNDSAYHDLIEKKTQMSVTMNDHTLSRQERLAVAEKKMTYGSLASQMESHALSNDATVQDARTRLMAAQKGVADLKATFEIKLYSRPQVTTARQFLANARANQAAADAFLAGAWITRGDSLDADVRRYPGSSSYFGWPYSFGATGIGLGLAPF